NGFDVVDGCQYALGVSLFSQPSLKPCTHSLPFVSLCGNATIGNDFDTVAIQGQIQQNAGVPRRIPDSQATENFQCSHARIALMDWTDRLNGDDQLPVVVAFGLANTFGNSSQHFRVEVAPA